MRREFTGRHMTAILIAGFGVVVAVNLFMATLATRGFGGVVVKNSYVASQKFNGWLDEAERQRALGWQAELRRAEDGRLEVLTAGVPAGAGAEAVIRRPLGKPETARLALSQGEAGQFVSDAVLPQGRWIVRLSIISGADRWTTEARIE